MEPLNFNFKKNRRFGDLIQDYFSLFKIVYRHLNARIISVALPFIAVFILLAYYMTTFISEIMRSSDPIGSVSGAAFIPLILFLVFILFFVLISAFGIEYMFLLEERRELNFTSNDIYQRVKDNLEKYVRFFLSSIVVGILLIIPLAAIAAVLAFIPIVGQLLLGVLAACMMLFVNCALFLYLQERETLWASYGASFRLVRARIFEYGAASYVFQLIIQIVGTLITMIPLIIIGVIAFTTVGFSNQFFDGFTGKFLVSLGGSIFMLFVIFFAIYMIAFYMLQYFSLLESRYKEDTLDQIDQIGGTAEQI